MRSASARLELVLGSLVATSKEALSANERAAKEEGCQGNSKTEKVMLAARHERAARLRK